MKMRNRILSAALLLITMVCMFLPIATFPENVGGELDADIAKMESRVQDAQSKLDRYISGGKDEATVQKQRDQVAKQQGKLDELLAQRDAAASTEAGASLSYSLLPGKLPEQIELDQTRINESGVYQANFDSYYLCIYVAFGLLALSLALFLLGRDKLVSPLFTFSAVLDLAAALLLGFVVLRLRAFPVKSPYADASVNWVQYVLIFCPIAALAVNVSAMSSSKRTMIYILSIFLSVLSILPFWIMIVNATRSSTEIQSGVSLIPGANLGKNLYILTSKNFNVMVGFRNSAIIAFGSTFLSVFFSSLTAYGLTVYNFKGSKFLYSFILAIIMIPTQVTATGFYMFMYRLGWVNSYWPLIIPAIAAPSTVFFLKQYLTANFQISLVEAARIDGSGEFRTFVGIILPIMVPAIATMGIMAVIGSWNNYLTPLMLLSNPDMKTLPMMVKELRGDIYRTEFGSIYLGLTLTALPLIIVYFALSKYIIEGVAVGGVKE